jgi:hypothetical protein
MKTIQESVLRTTQARASETQSWERNDHQQVHSNDNNNDDDLSALIWRARKRQTLIKPLQLH